MSFRASWIAVQGVGRDVMLKRLGLIETGDIDFSGDATLACVELANGWLLVRSDDFDFANPDRLAVVSEGVEAIGVQASSVVMVSAAQGYRDGEQAWSIEHDPDKGRRSLETTGELPAPFAAIRDRLMKEQAEHGGEQVDYLFDASLALSAAICGFRADEPSPTPGTLWREVVPVASGKAAEKQAERRAAGERLRARVEGEVYARAAELGFEPMSAHPQFYRFYPNAGSNAFVRLREPWSDGLQILWAYRDGQPLINIGFFVRRGAEPRYGGAGSARTDLRKLSLLEQFTGPKADPAALDRTILQAKELLVLVDQHLKGAPSGPRVRPAEFLDEAQPR